MAAVQRFEDLIVWQKARAFTKSIYEVTRQGTFARDFGLCNQMQRATVSIMSNIAEGFERKHSAEFLHYLSIAKASCAEVRSQLYVALDVEYIGQDMFNEMLSRADEIARLITGLRTSIERQGS